MSGTIPAPEPGEEFDLEEKQGELEDALRMARELVSHLECAETCETESDFRSNLAEARAAIGPLRDEIKNLIDGL